MHIYYIRTVVGTLVRFEVRLNVCTVTGKIQYRKYRKVPIIAVPMFGPHQSESLSQNLLQAKKGAKILRWLQNEMILLYCEPIYSSLTLYV